MLLHKSIVESGSSKHIGELRVIAIQVLQYNGYFFLILRATTVLNNTARYKVKIWKYPHYYD